MRKRSVRFIGAMPPPRPMCVVTAGADGPVFRAIAVLHVYSEEVEYPREYASGVTYVTRPYYEYAISFDGSQVGFQPFKYGDDEMQAWNPNLLGYCDAVDVDNPAWAEKYAAWREKREKLEAKREKARAYAKAYKEKRQVGVNGSS